MNRDGETSGRKVRPRNSGGEGLPEAGVRRIPHMAVQAARAAQELVFPRRCPVCDRPVQPFGALICRGCEETLVKVRAPVCRRCGKPLGHGDGDLCRDCCRCDHVFDRGCAVYTYHSAAGGIFRFKYGGRREYAAWYGKCMAEKLLDFTGGNPVREGLREYGFSAMSEPRERGGHAWEEPRGRGVHVWEEPRGRGGHVWEEPRDYGSPGRPGPRRRGGVPWPDMLVPVPLSRERLEKRGYNQARLLAEEISRRTGIPVRADVLRRVENTLPMKNMSFSERQNNLKKAFQVSGNDVELNSIMLIDDIYTTGATMDACAHALFRQGAGAVCFLVLAAGEA
ncbi:MAG: ComF family protein [Eubacteriales bacterium]|nr:ComF family protein [Eubacteriales bacterium]